MLPWIQKVQDHKWGNYNTVCLIPQARSATETAPPFESELTKFVVFVGYNPKRGTFVIGRIWKHKIKEGFFEWDQGEYDPTDFRAAMNRAINRSFA